MGKEALKSMIQHLIKDDISGAKMDLHPILAAKLSHIAGTKTVKEDQNRKINEGKRDYKDTLEDGLESEVEHAIDNCVEKVLSKYKCDVKVDVSSGGGYGNSHKYEGSIEVTSDSISDIEKIENLIKSKLSVLKTAISKDLEDEDYVSDVTVSFGGIAKLEDGISISISVDVEFDNEEDDNDEDDNEDDAFGDRYNNRR